MKRKILLAVLTTLLLLIGSVIAFNAGSVAEAADPPNQPFDLVYSVTDVKYRIYQDGVGMLYQTQGTLDVPNLDSPGVVKAYLVWAGLGRDDDGVLLRRDNEADTRIVPEMVWNRETFGGQATWGCCGEELTSYAADITDLNIVLTGNHNYTVSDMAVSHQKDGRTVTENWGYSLIIIYEDPTLVQTRDVYVKLGNDALFAGWDGLLGPNSDVQCQAFDPAAAERRANFSVIVGGVENASRRSALWGMADSADFLDRDVEGGTWNQDAGLIHLPPNIIGVYSDAAVGVYGGTQLDGPFPNDSVYSQPDNGSPFADRNGDEWDEYHRFDVPVAMGDSWVCVQAESASRDNRPTLPVPGPGTLNRPASIGFLGFIIVVEDLLPPPEPAIAIVKYTNGEDANDPNGPGVPIIAPGDAVTWTYQVTNVGLVDIPEADIVVTDSVEGTITGIIDKGDGDAVLAPHEVWLYQAVGTAIDLGSPPANPGLVLVNDVCTQGNADAPGSTAYTNVGVVTIPGMNDEDPSSYCNPQPDPLIDIIKYTNGFDANDPDGSDVPIIIEGDTVTWTYHVTNVGTVNIPEADITVTDNIEGTVTDIIDKGDGDDILAPDEVWIYQAVGVALNLDQPPADPGLILVNDVCTLGGTQGPPDTAYTNVGTVAIPSMSDDDPSSYCNPPDEDVTEPEIAIIKYTNGADANDPNGPGVPIIEPGDTVTWTYHVTNTGTVSIAEIDITVTDNVEGTITDIIDKGDGDDILAPDEVWIYQAVGIAVDLVSPPSDAGLILVDDVCTQGSTNLPAATAYTNIGTVTIPNMFDDDPSSYCPPPPTAIIDDSVAPDRPDLDEQIFIPILHR
ncbi:MAG: hypothetical protein H6642_05765 [Caldilineaceae bacterium]|nr:hypothetical protein [Caldilineaceae bacterium]